MPYLHVRKRTRHQRPVHAVVHYVGVVNRPVTHVLDPCLRESGLRLPFGVHGVSEDSDVDAHETVQDVLVGGLAGGAGGEGGVEAPGKTDGGWLGEGGV